MDQFVSDDLIWVKNVKRDEGNAWAYLDTSIGDIFKLDWSRGRANMGKTNARSPRVNDLILIFQTINKLQGFKKGTYLTHIVTPIDNTVEERNTERPYYREVIVVAKNDMPIPKSEILHFGIPKRGWIYDIDTIGFRTASLTRAQKQNFIWELFTEKDAGLIQFASIPTFQEYEGEEGGMSKELRRHKYYERDSKIIKNKKAWAIENNLMVCETCDFDFLERYGLHGQNFMECHHRTPIASGGIRRTRLDDLALVCSNCHRMLHRKNSEGNYFTTEQLRALIIEQKQNAIRL